MKHTTLIDKKEYFKSLISKPDINGAHDSQKDIRGRLGLTMKKLKESDHGDNEYIVELLEDLYEILDLGYPFEVFEDEYAIYLRLLCDREEYKSSKQGCLSGEKKVDSLKKSKWNHWGCYKQFIFGKCVVDVLNNELGCSLHPIWGCLLSPTGGICGPGNKALLTRRWDSYISLHSCVHDAAGYLYNFHGLGPGYNYLNTWFTLAPTSSPMSCQISGLRFWKRFLKD